MINKKYFLITILALMMSAVCFAGSYSNPTFAKRLPQPAKVFIKEKFHNATIVLTEGLSPCEHPRTARVGWLKKVRQRSLTY